MAKKEITYELWAEGYDENDFITDYDVFIEAGTLSAMTDKCYAMERNPKVALAKLDALQKIPKKVKRIAVYVEKCHYDGFETVADDTITEISLDVN